MCEFYIYSCTTGKMARRFGSLIFRQRWLRCQRYEPMLVLSQWQPQRQRYELMLVLGLWQPKQLRLFAA